MTKVVESILNSNVGIFGFSIKDSGQLQKNQWFDGINRLVYWVMLLLPIDPEKPTTIKFKIEEYGGDTGDEQLLFIKKNLESKLKTIDSKRYKNIHINLEFIPKTGSNYNAYIDTVAYTWGSAKGKNNRASQQRLKKSGWEDHCLLRPNEDAIERLFLAVNSKHKLEPQQWYEICSATALEPKTSLLHSQLAIVGEKTKSELDTWNSYINYVTKRLREKLYNRVELDSALIWLDKYHPQNSTMPLLSELFLTSAKLASLNHSGKVDYGLVAKALNLADKIKNESAHDACQVILRIFSMTTNNFEFDVVKEKLKEWLKLDIAIPGTLNHGKILSSLGQISAFNRKEKEAIELFNKAIDVFEQLSDTTQAQMNSEQTSIYRLIASMDSDIENSLNEFEKWHNDLKKNHKQLARSDNSYRFMHHTLLRGFVVFHDSYTDKINEYLNIEDEWLTFDDYPWHWINAYRGWLFALKANKNLSREYFNLAIESCNENGGITISWIGLVIELIAKKLGIIKEVNISKLRWFEKHHKTFPVTDFKKSMKSLKPDSQQDLLVLLAKLVPFNFH